ncbi:hypothetical protein [Marinobacter sp.]|uniref:hypothetical protein n=1 Tax=Marinobacter sp. TaxID=50741 RepID=UPI0035C74F42
MPKFWKPLILISSLFVTVPVYGKDPLSGAFGIEFGKRLSGFVNNPDIGISSTDGSFKSISITPPIKNKLFSSYSAKVDPDSGKVAAIEATDIIKGRSSCLSTLEDIGQYLEHKYGDAFELETHGEDGEKKFLFALTPARSSNLIAGGCYETNLERKGLLSDEEKGFFYNDEDVLYYLKIIYGSAYYFNKMYDPDYRPMDGSGL